MSRLGILGGTFDPIHVGHLRLGIEAMERLALDRLVFEVAAVSPLKAGAEMTDGQVRAEMVQAAIAETERMELGIQELRRQGPSFTVDTLNEYGGQAEEIVLVVGSDALASFDQWKDPEGILERAR